MSMAVPTLTLSGIERFYHGTRVLGPVSVKLYPAEIVGISGANGAGKTTLLSIMAGIIAPSAGERKFSDPHAVVGYVPQEIALYGAMSGKANLEFWADVYGLPRDARRARISWLLTELGLADKAHARVDAYSGGMKRRLNLAAALLRTPALLLLDEPTVGADAASVDAILCMIRKMSVLGCTVVFISHHQNELRTVCSRILEMDHGCIVSTLSPQSAP